MTRVLRLLSGFCLAFVAFVAAPAGVSDSHGPLWQSAAAAGKTAEPQLPPPSLQQRQRAAREASIRRSETHCRAVARDFAALQNRPCATGDRLDARSNVCQAQKNLWMPYVRWDPAAGRCKPRDSFDGAVCVGTKQRYQPGRQHAQTLSRSLGMYGNATAQLEARLDECRQAAEGMKHRASDERMKNAKACEQARKLNRGDLVRTYCN